nr:arylamine N-acetyltransferase [uncultured Roseibium sp.]
MPFHLATYLDRIGLEDCPVNLGGLKQLQTAQISTIPFENVMPFSGQVPDLDPSSLWRKLVLERCGGYCFEVNTLLGEALDALGFTNRRVLARVRMGEARGGARTHLAFVVPLDGDEWLVDAGFGGQAPAEPMKISLDEEQPIRGQIYRIRFEDHSGEHVLERKTDSGWFPLYGFDRVDVRDEDIAAANFVCALSPMQSFAGNLKFYRLTEAGFVSFLNGRARCVDGGESREWQIREQPELKHFMNTDLRLGYDDAAIEAVANRLKTLF